jgi:UDP-N-acetylglucosamine 2-epimerase (non-hydrolysing)
MTVLVCMGTRPEIIKMAPVVQALQQHALQPVVLHTGQHEDMAWPLYDFFGFQPDHVIQLKRAKPGLANLSAELLQEIAHVLEQVQPRAILVHGDTTSAAMGALAAFYQQVPVGHVEAGLRSGNKQEPFPEEMNRQLIGRIAQWHFAPTQGAVKSLAREGTTEHVLQVGNTVVDASLWARVKLQTLHNADSIENTAQQWFMNSGCKRLVVVTAHRRENWGAPMQNIIDAVLKLLVDDQELAIVWPVHLNPIVKDAVTQAHAIAELSVRTRWHLTDPLHYQELIDLMGNADALLTDSGGIQEEAVALKKPVFILRNVTERPEVLECGLGHLVGTDAATIVSAVQQYLASANKQQHLQGFTNPFGDGTSALQIARFLVQQLDLQSTVKNT